MKIQKTVSVHSMISYLKRAHIYFLDYQFPMLRQKLVSAIDYSRENDIAYLILRYFERYVDEVSKHMRYEEENVFRYVEDLISGHRPYTTQVQHLLSNHHEDIELRFHELHDLFVEYYPDINEKSKLHDVLDDLCNIEEDLTIHCMVEDNIFVPAVKKLKNTNTQGHNTSTADIQLSDREKDIAVCVAKGLSNKEIANKLFLSINTVTTHRRNIAKKLNIHSPAGITIYCIVNKLVTPEEINQL